MCLHVIGVEMAVCIANLNENSATKTDTKKFTRQFEKWLSQLHIVNLNNELQ